MLPDDPPPACLKSLQPPVRYFEQQLGSLCQFCVMGHKDDGLAHPMDPRNVAHDFFRGLRIQIPRWLIHEEYLRIVGERSCYRDSTTFLKA